MNINTPRQLNDENLLPKMSSIKKNETSRMDNSPTINIDSMNLPSLDQVKFASYVLPNDSNLLEASAQEIIKKKMIKSVNIQVVKSCRICLGDENETDNALISPCKCSGTMKYIHLKCL